MEQQRLERGGVKVNIDNGSGWRPLHLACAEGHLLHWACQKGHLVIVILVIHNHGADLHAKDDNGMTPLHYACSEKNHWEVVQLLLNLGANAKAEITLASTALQIASERNWRDAVHVWLLVRRYPWLVPCWKIRNNELRKLVEYFT